MAPLVNLHSATCSGDGQTYTSHLEVSHASMLATSSGSFEADAGLHFQLPPTIGRRLMKRRAVRVTFIMAEGGAAIGSGHANGARQRRLGRVQCAACGFELRRVRVCAVCLCWFCCEALCRVRVATWVTRIGHEVDEIGANRRSANWSAHPDITTLCVLRLVVHSMACCFHTQPPATRMVRIQTTRPYLVGQPSPRGPRSRVPHAHSHSVHPHDSDGISTSLDRVGRGRRRGRA